MRTTNQRSGAPRRLVNDRWSRAGASVRGAPANPADPFAPAQPARGVAREACAGRKVQGGAHAPARSIVAATAVQAAISFGAMMWTMWLLGFVSRNTRHGLMFFLLFYFCTCVFTVRTICRDSLSSVVKVRFATKWARGRRPVALVSR